MDEPPKKYKSSLSRHRVRLMYAYYVNCAGYDTDEQGNITAYT